MEFDSTQPIWLQLVAEFSRRISVGEWPPGDRIPGVRELALDLGVNPNTVQRAFREMERDGLVRAERTSGRFVTGDQELITELRSQLVASTADDFISQALGFGMSESDAVALIERRWSQHPQQFQKGEDE